MLGRAAEQVFLLDVIEQLVKGVDEGAEFAADGAMGAHGIIAAGGNSAGHPGEVFEWAGDQKGEVIDGDDPHEQRDKDESQVVVKDGGGGVMAPRDGEDEELGKDHEHAEGGDEQGKLRAKREIPAPPHCGRS